MKNLTLTLLVLFFTISCKKQVEKETKETEKEVTEVSLETAKVTENDKPVIDYASFGIAAGDIPKGLETGSEVPEVNLINEKGETVSLANLYEAKPLVVIFYRGYWCPVCNKYLSALTANVSQIEEKGAGIIAITPETYENIAKTREKTGLSIPVYYDKDGAAMKAFDVDFAVTTQYDEKIQEKLNASIKETNGADTSFLPVPATYIIDKEGKIIYKQFDPDYHNRASAEEILKHIPQ
ncbi:peroxiredoxin-like family protein [Abyssalbus ytuae]|uniref:thioredoxin-dependent peroxiredoxin n=1 Tax=Abyssalbus ytuae TaxID=2926907 RepID=A0A9E6ZR26_9FLAO|nr:peroxiredoxin-like family protein [Abyssalbus ytuae]UOB17238.1 AhpC/TSA family protein [Abyssalbus ytuae]